MAIGMFNLLVSSNFDWLKTKNLGHKTLTVIQSLVGLSFGIYLIHTYIVTVLSDIGFDFNRQSMNVYLYNLANYSLVLGVSILIVYLIKKIPRLRMIIGEL